MPLLTVISVTYNDLIGLERTLHSLESIAVSAGDELEVLVVDGGDLEGIKRLAADFPWADIESEGDLGIYDAMNKGLERSRGDFVWFLNGGDENVVSEWPKLRNLLKANQSRLIFASYILMIGSRSIHRKSRNASYIWHALPTSHQAIFYPGMSARSEKYDLAYKMSADYQYTAQLLRGGVESQQTDLLVARFRADGFSAINAHLVAKDAYSIQRDILMSSYVRRRISAARHFISRTVRRIQGNF